MLGRLPAPGFFGLTVTGPAGSFLVDTVQPAETLAEDDGPRAELFVNSFNGFDVVTGHGCTSDADSCHGLGVQELGSQRAQAELRLRGQHQGLRFPAVSRPNDLYAVH